MTTATTAIRVASDATPPNDDVGISASVLRDYHRMARTVTTPARDLSAALGHCVAALLTLGLEIENEYIEDTAPIDPSDLKSEFLEQGFKAAGK